MPGKKHFLIIDDDKITLWLTEKILRVNKLAKKVDTASNGEIALHTLHYYHQFHKSFPDIILVDLHMPVMDGLQFIASFNTYWQAQKSKVDIAVVTASLDPADFDKVRALGVKHIISKPLNEEKLLKLLAEKKERT